MYGVGKFKRITETFSPILERLRNKRQQMPWIIMYCHTEPPLADEINKFAL